VNYGLSGSYGSSSPASSALTTNHTVTLTGLTPGAVYNFAASSANSAGQSSASANYTFATMAAALPVISNVTAGSVGTTSAVITWTTDQATSSLVNYGTGSNYGSASTLNSALVTSHSVTITGLAAGTTYNFDVVSANSTNHAATSGNQTFSTTALELNPVISNIAASGVTSTSATITWTTDQPSTSQVTYGTSSVYGASSPLSTAMVTSHSVTLTGLTAGTTYNFQVSSANAGNANTTSPNNTFATPSAATGTAPKLSYVAYWGITSSGITISWSTDVPATTVVAFGTSTALGQTTPVEANLSNSHGLTLSNLTPGTTYYFEAQSTGANGVTGSSTVYSFTTLGNSGPVISGVAAMPSADHTAQISWTTSVPANSYIVYGLTTGYGSWSTRTNLGTVSQLSIGWVPSGVIHYQIVSMDSYGNQSMSPDFTFVEP
jgi:hypothetical protein